MREGDVTREDFSFAGDADLIFHMASLASPVYYRLHPIETMDADVVGLRRLLDFYGDRGIFNLLFYSTSEVYGDPDPRLVPTPETYWGNVNSSGPRSCYDESKRYAETLCYNFHYQRGFPVTVLRPFNSFGPGLRTNDKRARQILR
ncbi:NAD-dependent epimerase/dehydratase family protein [Paenibacillus sp. D2_2]|uniref:NAD-dependent epimerase/dehydratase family protein n=1 Tax=Paenibacillus sp. D2_2 TaxID=3073092 RepID=UPI00281662C6|nr:NAD-dependent epimerase/dehydratase family protein [Paenibacillus sp. D2_2]WMT40468.1 NAD-dependent epimerase/dehydratase family protein [Paenibacillus sp. D2_2]